MSGKIAIIGAGPSGCYLAQALLKRAPALNVHVVDALPVPYGLIRYGVAADHQSTKNVTRQFARIFERQGARFFGNVHVGRDVTLDDLLEAYDAVVIATGLSTDRRLGIPGDDRPGLYGSGVLTRALNDHPHAPPLPALGQYPLIVGHGNVAIDLLRLLCKTSHELDGSDMGSKSSAWLAKNDIKSITVVGRSPATLAKFDSAMIREIGKLDNVSITVRDTLFSQRPDDNKRLHALAAINGQGNGTIKVTFRFSCVPLSVIGDESVLGLQVRGPEGEEHISASTILTAIGFEGALDREHLLKRANENKERLYCVGWFHRGPKGTIADSRTEAQTTAERILNELSPDPERVGSTLFYGSSKAIVDYATWQRIDAAEIAQSTPNRCRQKFTSTSEFLRAAQLQGGQT